MSAPTHHEAVPTDTPHPVPLPRWVISDTHFGHASILTYCPWRQTWATTVEQHDEMLLASWRRLVRPDDWVLHLGDVAFGPKDRLAELRRALPGRIILIRGNHDRSLAVMRAAGFDHVHAAASIEADGHRWVARHNPAAFSVREASNSVRLLHGHSHGNGYAQTIHATIQAKAVDCSLDALKSIGPVPWETVR
jgi:calcineurin-like phosphoesterase family protein